MAENHQKATEQWVGYYKKASKIPSITWPESVDQALCFGWIDGLRKSIDARRYKIRFTPRRPNSLWSAVNLKRVPELIESGLMTPAGLAIYEQRNPEKAELYAQEREEALLNPEYEDAFRRDPLAWSFFENLAPSYRKASVHYVMSAKREETRQKRLKLLIDCSREQRKLPQFSV